MSSTTQDRQKVKNKKKEREKKNNPRLIKHNDYFIATLSHFYVAAGQ